MKKLFVFFAVLSFSFSVYAQKSEEIKASALPKTITSWISKNFKKSTTEKAVKIMDNKTLLGYCVVVAADGRKTVFVFDKNGKYLDRIKKITDLQGILKPTQTVTQPVKK